jgi:Xaa-Pro aminopeptidase
MHREQRQRTHELLQQRGIQRAIFAKLESVKWLTGFTPPIVTGPNLFAGGPPFVWYEDRHFILLILDSHANIALPFAAEPDGSIATYQGYALEQPLAFGANLKAKIRELVGTTSGKVGVEAEWTTYLFTDSLPATCQLVPVDGWLEPLRTVKTAEELAKLRANFRLSDIGHEAARATVQVGKREIDVWNALHNAIHAAAGQRVQVGNDCIVGHRQDNISGWPLDYEIVPHDSLIVDISSVLHGYWSDSCATYYAGERTPKQAKMHQTAKEALEYGISLVRPGVVARDLDQKLRQFMTDAGYTPYPHHTGHGVGVSGHEAPRIVPYNDEVLQEGMVIMLEPGIYFPGETSVRLEDGLLIAKDGAEILTHHSKD